MMGSLDVKMERLVCQHCGSNELQEKSGAYYCRYCNSTFNKVELKHEYAEGIRSCIVHRNRLDFATAEEYCKQLLNDDENNIYALWQMVLIDYQIIYMKDYDQNYKPIIIKYIDKPIEENKYYKKLIKLSNSYEDEVNRLQNLLNDTKKQLDNTSYDFFICTKINKLGTELSNDNKVKTPDYEFALDEYYRLDKKGYRIFLSEKTLQAGVDNDSRIYAALHQSNALVVITSSKEHMETPWVKSEWLRFLNLIKCGKRNANSLIILGINGFSEDDLPFELQKAKLQIYCIHKASGLDRFRGHLETLINSYTIILEIERKEIIAGQIAKKERNVLNSLKRAKLELEDSNFNEAEQMLDEIEKIDIDNYYLWLYRFFIDAKVKDLQQLINKSIDYSDNINYLKALKFANEEQKIFLISSVNKAKEKWLVQHEKQLKIENENKKKIDLEKQNKIEKENKYKAEIEKRNIEEKEKQLRILMTQKRKFTVSIIFSILIVLLCAGFWGYDYFKGNNDYRKYITLTFIILMLFWLIKKLISKVTFKVLITFILLPIIIGLITFFPSVPYFYVYINIAYLLILTLISAFHIKYCTKWINLVHKIILISLVIQTITITLLLFVFNVKVDNWIILLPLLIFYVVGIVLDFFDSTTKLTFPRIYMLLLILLTMIWYDINIILCNTILFISIILILLTQNYLKCFEKKSFLENKFINFIKD